MSRATRSLIGEVGDVKTRCRSLLDLLSRLDRMVDGTEDPTPAQEAEVADANWRWGNGTKHLLDLAFADVQAWQQQVSDALHSNRK